MLIYKCRVICILIALAFNLLGKGTLRLGQMGYFSLSGVQYELKRTMCILFGIDLITISKIKSSDGHNDALFCVRINEITVKVKKKLMKDLCSQKMTLETISEKVRSEKKPKNTKPKKGGLVSRVLSKLTGTLYTYAARMFSISVDKILIEVVFEEIPDFTFKLDMPKGMSLFSDCFTEGLDHSTHTLNLCAYSKSVVLCASVRRDNKELKIIRAEIPLHIQLSIVEYDQYSKPSLEQVLISLGKVSGFSNVDEVLNLWKMYNTARTSKLCEQESDVDSAEAIVAETQISKFCKTQFLIGVDKLLSKIPGFSQLTVDVMDVKFCSIDVGEKHCSFDCRIEKTCFTLSRHQDRGVLLSERQDRCEVDVELLGLSANFVDEGEIFDRRFQNCMSRIDRLLCKVEFGHNFISKGFGTVLSISVQSPRLVVNDYAIKFVVALFVLLKANSSKKTPRSTLQIRCGNQTFGNELGLLLGESVAKVMIDFTDCSALWMNPLSGISRIEVKSRFGNV